MERSGGRGAEGEMTDEAREKKRLCTQKRDGGETGGLKVFGGKKDKDGIGGINRGGISTHRQIEIIWNATAACSLHRHKVAAYTTHTRCLKDLLGACGDVSHSIHITVPQHTQTCCAL